MIIVQPADFKKINNFFVYVWLEIGLHKSLIDPWAQIDSKKTLKGNF